MTRNPIVVLGNHQLENMQVRATTAFRHAGPASQYLCSGFASEQIKKQGLSEAQFLAQKLHEQGVPLENILIDNDSKNTIATMHYIYDQGITGTIPFVSYPGHLSRVERIAQAFNKRRGASIRVQRVETNQTTSETLYETLARPYLEAQLLMPLDIATKNPPFKDMINAIMRRTYERTTNY